MRRAQGQSNPWSGRIAACAAAAACLAGTGALRADGGVAFTNIAAGGGAGIQYERLETPALLAQQLAFYQGVQLPHPGLLAQTPQKPHGAPGVVVFDYDNDGDMDIYVTNGPGGKNSLFQNQFAQTGVVTFVDVADRAGVTATSQDSTGVCFGDLDNDGYEDLYVLGLAANNILFRNNGNGTFSDITAAAGVGGGTYHHASCAMGDFNNDGYLDIAVADTYDDWTQRAPIFVKGGYAGGEPNLLFMRNPSRHGIQFDDTSASSGVQSASPLARKTLTWGISAVDVDQDGNVDLLWADLQGGTPPSGPGDDRGYTRLLKNDGTGHFTDVTQQAHMAWGSWMGLAYGDFNCDGNLDFVATNLGNYVGGKLQPTRWFLGDGHGGFTDPGLGTMNASPFGWGVAVADYDNDGDQDIMYYGDDDLLTIIGEDNPGTILQNTGNCTANFQPDLTAISYDHQMREVNGVAAGDLNNDGFTDIVTVSMFQIEEVPGFHRLFTAISIPYNSIWDTVAKAEVIMLAHTAPDGSVSLQFVPTQFYRGDLAVEINSGNNGNGAVAIRTVGSFGITDGGKVNRDGMGAVLKFTPDGGKTVISPILGGGSHASQSSRVAGFGLGTAAKGTVDVLWPGGTRNRLYDVANGERLNLPEIPCSYAATWKNFGQYNSCLHHAINDLRKAGVVSEQQGQRLIDSATRAYNER
jgi:hypothetical protein